MSSLSLLWILLVFPHLEGQDPWHLYCWSVVQRPGLNQPHGSLANRRSLLMPLSNKYTKEVNTEQHYLFDFNTINIKMSQQSITVSVTVSLKTVSRFFWPIFATHITQRQWQVHTHICAHAHSRSVCTHKSAHSFTVWVPTPRCVILLPAWVWCTTHPGDTGWWSSR